MAENVCSPLVLVFTPAGAVDGGSAAGATCSCSVVVRWYWKRCWKWCWQCCYCWGLMLLDDDNNNNNNNNSNNSSSSSSNSNNTSNDNYNHNKQQPQPQPQQRQPPQPRPRQLPRQRSRQRPRPAEAPTATSPKTCNRESASSTKSTWRRVIAVRQTRNPSQGRFSARAQPLLAKAQNIQSATQSTSPLETLAKKRFKLHCLMMRHLYTTFYHSVS